MDASDHVAERIVQCHRATLLPARLDQARYQPLGAELPKSNARELVLAIEAARPARHLASVADPRRRRVARQLSEFQHRRKALLHRPLLVARDRLEARAA